MKKLLSIGTLAIFLVALASPAIAQNPPKDSVKSTKTECPMKKGDKKCTKSCDHKNCAKSCCKESKNTECKNK